MTNLVHKSLFALFTVALSCVGSYANDGKCSHSPIIYRSRPVIERLPLRVVDPVDVVVSEFGDTLVADRVGKVVFRIDARGETSLLGKDFDGLSRLVYSKAYGPHALLSGKGSGHIVQITESGHQARTHLPFRPTGLAVDREGSVLTTNSATGQVWKIDAEGTRAVLNKLKKLHEPTKDLVVDSFGTAIVLLQSGKVMSVFASDTNDIEGYLPPTTTRIAIDPNSQIVGLATDAAGKSVLLRPGKKPGEHQQFGGAPYGTSAFAFDKLGNVTMANPDLRAITRVTSHFRIPCPHCGKKVDMLFSPDAPLPEQENLRSF